MQEAICWQRRQKVLNFQLHHKRGQLIRIYVTCFEAVSVSMPFIVNCDKRKAIQ